MREFNTQLLCTFAKQQTYSETIDALFAYYQIPDGRIYVLQSGLSKDDIFLTFNATKTGGEFYPQTMSVHRKKEYNILYSINALNELIKSLSFELAARMGYKDAAKQAGAKLMEPIMAVDVVTPDEYTGPITGDLNRRRGIMKGMDSRQGAVILKADVPLSELFGYVTDLRTMSSGRATASLTFSHYEFVPQNLAEEVVKKAKGL